MGQVRFVNDSKATNADAARQAMSSYPKFYWIAGGRPKTGGIDDLADLFPRAIEGLSDRRGDAAPSPRRSRARPRPCESGDRSAAAVGRLCRRRGLGARTPSVLLSPACASFDQFADFEARGEAFRAAVAA